MDGKKPLDATFGIEVHQNANTITFESRSGKIGHPSARNSDYGRGLDLLLERLKTINPTVRKITLHPANGKEGSILAPIGYSFPLLLSGVGDTHKLRLALSRAQQSTDREANAKGSGNPTKRIRIYLDTTQILDLKQLERRLAGIDTRRYWAFFANPSIYRIDDAVAELMEDTWTIKGKPVSAGDRALIWRGRGNKGEERGIVAFADVLDEPKLLDDLGNSYWVKSDGGKGITERVRVRYLTSPMLPLLENGPNGNLLRSLPVSRARGGTVFAVDPETFEEVVKAAGGWGTDPVAIADALDVLAASVDRVEASKMQGKRKGKSQGFGLTHSERLAVMGRAIVVATSHFHAEGWQVEDVGSTESFDLLCKKNGVELHVEVKGTTGLGETVILPRNEVNHARDRFPNTALVIVSEIILVKGPEPTARGGNKRLFMPWEIDRGKLDPLAFYYSPPSQ